MTCEHLNFAAHVAVNRVTDDAGVAVLHFMADVRIACADCGQQFRFVGLPGGYSADAPTVSIDAETAQLPIGPAESTMSPLDKIAQGTAQGTA